MKITTEESLSFYSDQGEIIIAAMQYDTARQFVFKLESEDTDNLSDVSYVTLHILHPDNTVLVSQNVCSWDASANTITLDTSKTDGEYVLSNAGRNKCEFVFYGSDKNILTTWPFCIYVEASSLNNELASVDHNYLQMIQDMVASVNTYSSEAKESADAAATSETNAANSAQISSDSATASAASAKSAESSATTAEQYATSAKEAQSYAVGGVKNDDGSDYREGQDTDNSKYYAEQAEYWASIAQKIAEIEFATNDQIDAIFDEPISV